MRGADDIEVATWPARTESARRIARRRQHAALLRQQRRVDYAGALLLQRQANIHACCEARQLATRCNTRNHAAAGKAGALLKPPSERPEVRKDLCTQAPGPYKVQSSPGMPMRVSGAKFSVPTMPLGSKCTLP